MAPTTPSTPRVAVGDRLVVRAHFQGQPERDAEILEVLGADGPPYRVRWDDGRESIIFPGPDVFVEHFRTSTSPRVTAPAQPRPPTTGRGGPGAVAIQPRDGMTTTAQATTRVSSVIEIRGLCKDFGQGRGVFDLDLDVGPGEIVGFLGPNGAGKSTTMRMLLGLIRPTGGRAAVLGSDVTADSLEIRRRTGYLAGDFGLYRQLTGRRMLHHLAALQGGVPPAAIAELAERFDASLDRPIRDLSTGNRQKIGLIQALMHRPELLILDEPIAGLDPLVQRNFHELLHEVRAEGRSVFLSSHTLSEVDRVADRVAIIRRGRLAVVDRLENLRAQAVRRLEIEFARPPDPAEFRAIPGVRTAEASGPLLHVTFEGSADALVKAAAAHDVLSIRSREDELEDIFLRYYQEEHAG